MDATAPPGDAASGPGAGTDDGSAEASLPLTDLSATPGTADGDDFLVAVARAPAAPPPRELEAGAIVGHGFRIERRLGAGGMGVVYLATDLTLGREVALKVHRAHGGFDRLQREAMAMARLAHPNVITVHEIGRIEDRLFVAMEYVAGRTLRDWMKAPHSWREVLAMMREVGRGLIAAHDAGLVHRDFKPENVLVGPDGRPRVGDFGLVRVVSGPPSLPGDRSQPFLRAAEFAVTPRVDDRTPGTGPRTGPRGVVVAANDDDVALDQTTAPLPGAAPPSSGEVRTADRPARRGPDAATLVPADISTADPDPDRLTATGAVLGTPAYMAPEQFAGQVVDARADQFGFCVVLFEALYKVRPFPGRSHGEILRAIEGGQLRGGTRRGPRWLRRIVERGLAADPAARFPSLQALQHAIDRGLRRRAIVAIGGGIAIGGVAAVAVALASGVRGPAGEPACLAAGGEINALWSPATRAELASTGAAADAEVGARIAGRVADRLDRLVGGYRDVAVQACRAHDVDRRWDDELVARSRACLDQTLAAVRDVVTFPLRTRRDLGVLAQQIAQVPDPQRCADPARLASLPRPAAGLVHNAVGVAALRALAELRTAHAPIAVREARLGRIAAVAAALGDPIVDVRVRLARALNAVARGDDATGEVLAKAAFQAARALGDDDGAVEASVLVIQALATVQRKFADARAWVEITRGDVARAPFYAAEFDTASATLAEREERFDDAIKDRRAAVKDFEDRRDTGSIEYAAALEQLATSLDAGGRSADAVPLFETAIALIEKLGGPDSPALFNPLSNATLALEATGRYQDAVQTGLRAGRLAEQWRALLPAESVPNSLLNYGVALDYAGHPLDAETAYLSARAGYQALPGDQRESVALIESNLANLYINLARYPAALASSIAAENLRTALGMTASLDVANALITRGDIYTKLDRCAEALPVFARGIAMARQAGPDHTEWMVGVVGEVSCLRKTHQLAQARAALAAAAAALTATTPPSRRGPVLWSYAQVLHELHEDPARIRPLLEAAAAAFRADDPASADLARVLAALGAWP
jgi:serine/threonine protein kinase/tetratricopeptide (TPR) repeat protein